MSKLILPESMKIYKTEVGMPLDISIKLHKKFEMISVSIGYNIKGIAKNDRNVVIYEDFYNVDKFEINTMLEDTVPPTYFGDLLNVEWFIIVEVEESRETFAIEVYPKNHSLFMEHSK